MGMNAEDRINVRKIIRSNSKSIYELEEVIDMLAKIDDKGHSRKRVYIESADGLQRIPVSFIELDKQEGVIIIG